jgi:AbrB family looped-hinge helix DNA binding protein
MSEYEEMSQAPNPVSLALQARTKINANGRIVIPAEIRKAMGIQPGETLVMEVVDGALHIESFQRKLARMQDELIQLVGPDRSLADELVADRREEARREEEEWARQEIGPKRRKAG